MDPPPSPKGFRKRWLDAASSPADRQESIARASADGGDTPSDGLVVSSINQDLTSGNFSKRQCCCVSDVGIEAAQKILRRPVTKMPWETGALAPIFTGKFPMQYSTDLPKMTLVGIEDIASDNPTNVASAGLGTIQKLDMF